MEEIERDIKTEKKGHGENNLSLNLSNRHLRFNIYIFIHYFFTESGGMNTDIYIYIYINKSKLSEQELMCLK